MFERFTKDARDVVRGAVTHCEGSGARVVGVEHLLLALLEREASRGAFALAALGADRWRESVREELAAARRRAGLSRAEADALAGLGIDVTEIVSRVEEAHGVGALSGDVKDRERWGGRRSFSREAKGALERSLRIALDRRERHIGDEHILLAVTVLPGVPAEVLADHGVTFETVTRVLYGGGELRAG
ncbi:peptidase [Streptomyces roseirectus]|uniref:Peptidase n=1 Tax=Streptomyces roseirectus TaxID=2768066 RepID=A0A7H0IBU9_9ACTN|nr:Clp protease N-terminal domain-containing protein [Streptomyces roseirectus]QNP70265.1 peptidase [Streptomyces roseirectus]